MRFYEKGFLKTKMKDISEEARIPVGLVYTYYKNKEGQYNRVELSYYTNLLLGNNNLYYTSVSDMFIRI